MVEVSIFMARSIRTEFLGGTKPGGRKTPLGSMSSRVSPAALPKDAGQACFASLSFGGYPKGLVRRPLSRVPGEPCPCSRRVVALHPTSPQRRTQNTATASDFREAFHPSCFLSPPTRSHTESEHEHDKGGDDITQRFRPPSPLHPPVH